MPDVNAGIQFTSWRPHSFYWNICDRAHIYDRDIEHSILSTAQTTGITGRIAIMNSFNNTHVHNLFYARGPQLNEVEKYTSRTIKPVSFKEVGKINQVKQEGNELRVYRPQVQNPQPRSFKRADNNDIKPLRTDDDKPVMQRSQQIDNMNRLPARTAPGSMFGGGSGKAGGRRH